MNYWTQSKNNIYVAAHRGFKEKYPENTLLAFKKALELDVDQIETDVRITKDKVLVLIHDDKIDRTTNGKGKVCDYTYKELLEFDAGEGERIPTLEDLFELVKDHPTLTLDLELKEYPEFVGDELAFYVCDETLKMVEKYNFADRIVINSFSSRLNEYIFKTYGKKYRQHGFFPKHHMTPNELDPYTYLYCACVFGAGENVSIEEILKLQKDYGVRIWAPASTRDEATIDLCVSYEAELITCNNPDEVLTILRNKGLHK